MLVFSLDLKNEENPCGLVTREEMHSNLRKLRESICNHKMKVAMGKDGEGNVVNIVFTDDFKETDVRYFKRYMDGCDTKIAFHPIAKKEIPQIMQDVKNIIRKAEENEMDKKKVEEQEIVEVVEMKSDEKDVLVAQEQVEKQEEERPVDSNVNEMVTSELEVMTGGYMLENDLLEEIPEETLEEIQEEIPEETLEDYTNSLNTCIWGYTLLPGKHAAVIASDPKGEYHLEIRAVKSTKAQRQYEVVEVRNSDGRDMVIENPKRFDPNELLDASASTKLNKLLAGCEGNYERQAVNISLECSKIVNDRTLDPRMEDIDTMDMKEIVDKLREWVIENYNDARVVVGEINREKVVGICKRGETSLKKVFESVISEIAPYNNPKKVKDHLEQEDLVEVVQTSKVFRDTHSIGGCGKIVKINIPGIVGKVRELSDIDDMDVDISDYFVDLDEDDDENETDNRDVADNKDEGNDTDVDDKEEKDDSIC